MDSGHTVKTLGRLEFWSTPWVPTGLIIKANQLVWVYLLECKYSPLVQVLHKSMVPLPHWGVPASLSCWDQFQRILILNIHSAVKETAWFKMLRSWRSPCIAILSLENNYQNIISMITSFVDTWLIPVAQMKESEIKKKYGRLTNLIPFNVTYPFWEFACN